MDQALPDFQCPICTHVNIRKRRKPGNEARPYASHDIEPKFTMKLSAARHAALGRCGESNTLTVTSIVKERTYGQYGKPSVPKLLLRHHNRNDVILHIFAPILRRRHITSLCCIIATTEMMSYYIFCQTRHMTSQTSYDILML